MGELRRDGWTLHYEVVGPADGPPVVLISGLGEQIGSVEFPDEHCDQLVDAGLRVVRVDNRDNGLSVPDDDPGDPDWGAIFGAIASGAVAAVPYSLADCADDVAAILDSVGVDQAVVVGASLGSAIARWTAIRHPDRVQGLMLVMGMSGAATADEGPVMTDDVIARLFFLTTPQDRDLAVSGLVECWRWLWGATFPFDEDWVRRRVEASYERSYRPQGVARNMAAATVPGLWEAQTTIQCPTLVMHGSEDPCCPPAHGRAITSQIAGAELWEVPGMGHTMHTELWPDMTKHLTNLASAP